jgi:hypothetical protein
MKDSTEDKLRKLGGVLGKKARSFIFEENSCRVFIQESGDT